MSLLRRPVLLVASAWLLAACRGEREASDTAGANGSGAPETPEVETRPAAVYNLINQLGGCEIRHRGLSLDLGTPGAGARRSYTVRPLEELEDTEREGATFARIQNRRVTYEFWLDEPTEDVFASLRLHGLAARSLAVLIDDKRLGVVKLLPRQTRIVKLPSLSTELDGGRHVVELRFSGGPRARQEPYAEVDWIRIGVPDEIQATYAAPTLRDISTNVVLDGRPMRAVALHAPSTIRCPLRAAPDAELHLALGFWGSGSGAAEIRVLRDGSAPATLLERKVTGGAGATWTTVALDLAKFGSRVVALELRATQASRDGRVAFGEPMITRRQQTELRVPATRTVVIIMASSVDRRRTPPWGPVGSQSALGALARSSAAFSLYRVPTTVPAAVMASLLTSLPPRAHALEDQAARLPEPVRALNEIVKEASGRAAMFTGVPTTSAAFGFGSGWDRYQTFSPVSDAPASEPLIHAAQWLEQALGSDPAPRFLVVHLRGAHPPWDVPKEEVTRLKPHEYGGAIDARRGGITLSGIRQRRNRAHRRIPDDDWVRLRALEEAAMIKQSAGLDQLFSVLRKQNAWDEALVVYLGDVGTGDPPELPYDPAGPLTEDRLLVPLLVKFPGSAFAGKDVNVPVTTTDIAYTVLEALRFKLPDGLGGLDLYAAAGGYEPVAGRALLATLGNRYATRIGSSLLVGESGKQPALCELSVDPACVSDASGSRPLTARAAWQWTYEAEAAARQLRSSEREPASIDAETGAALTVWGDVQ